MAIRETETSITLLGRLRDPSDHRAWSSFVDRYGPRICAWCLRLGVQFDDAADVTQEVLMKLVNAMRNDRFDPSRGPFRSWLKAVTNNAVRDLMRNWSKIRETTGGNALTAYLQSMQDPRAVEELTRHIEAQYEKEMLSQAEILVRRRVKSITWDVYRLSMKKQMKPAEIAEELQIPVGNIYVMRKRVINLLREEISKLEGAVVSKNSGQRKIG